MAASFRLLKGMSDAGWILGIGDACRASGKVAGVLMLDPTAPRLGSAAPPLVRVLVNSRTLRLQLRKHDAGKATCGRWQNLARHDAPRNARGWAAILARWSGHVADATAGRTPWVLADLLKGDPNRCRTRADANRHHVSPSGGPGRGRKCKGLPGGLAILGYSPATGRGAATHPIPEGMAKLVATNVAHNGRRHAMNGGSQ